MAGAAPTTRSGETRGRYMLPVGAHLLVADGQEVFQGDIIAKIPREITKTKDITGGLPRVAELFEARKPKEQAVITEIDGAVEFAGFVKGMRKIVIRADDGETKEYLIPRGKHISVHEGDRVKAGEALMDGSPNPHDYLAVLGDRELQRYLVNEVQEVYRLQGVTINDKHIEIIVRQMLRRVRIEEVGDTDFVVGRARRQVRVPGGERQGDRAGQAGRRRPSRCCSASPRRRCRTDSFISAASFQETTRVLTEAAISGKMDDLRGLKENVIVGRLIPAGTGLSNYTRAEVLSQGGDEQAVETAVATEEPILDGEADEIAQAGYRGDAAENLDRQGLFGYKVRVLASSPVTESHADHQPARPEGPRGGAEEVEDARDGGLPAEAGRLHPRLHHHAEEAELRAPQGRARAPDQRARGDLVHPGSRPQSAGALDRPHPGRPCEGSAGYPVSHHPRLAGHRGRGGPQAEPVEVRGQAAEGRRRLGCGGRGRHRREVLPDPKYGSRLVAKFVNMMMYGGKKSTAEHIMYSALGSMEDRAKQDALKLFKAGGGQLQARRRGEVAAGGRLHLPGAGGGAAGPPGGPVSMRWLIGSARRRAEKSMADKLAGELLDAANNRGARGEEARRHSQDGGGQQGVRALPLVAPEIGGGGPRPRPPSSLV